MEKLSRALLLALVGLLCSGAGARAATVTEFYDGISLGSEPSSITSGPDGNLWFTEPGTDQIGRITPSGTVTEFYDGISLDSSPSGITSGPGGNLWFTEPGVGQIGRITPAGDVTEFPVGGEPRAIVTGTDGNLWYTDVPARQIVRFTPAGVVTRFSTTTTNSGGGLTALTVGPDGSIWFCEVAGDVGRITMAGALTRFPVNGFLEGIATGSDGNLWITEYSGRIRRMSPQGDITGTFSLPLRATAHGITAGPDGNLWFTATPAQIGRITPSGAVVMIGTGISADSRPRGITAGPDGNIWFAELNADQIGRITTAIDPPAVTIGDASTITETSAALAGTVNAQSLSTSARFEYGPTPDYGIQTPEQAVSAATDRAVSAALTGLAPATTYHYRLIASSAGGSAQSADRTFTTSAVASPPPPPAAPPAPACSNGLDDDRDGFADAKDPSCHSDADPGNARSHLPQSTSESPVDNPVLVCSADQLALVGVELANQRRRIRLSGIAAPGQAGRLVGLYAGGRRAAQARVKPDGSFQATLDAAKRNPGDVRYQARLGTRRSQPVVAQRRFADVRLTVTGGKVVLTGRVTGRRPRSVELLGRAGGCGSLKRLATVRVPAGGRFTLNVAAFAEVDIGTYRAGIGAAGAAGPRASTLPRAIALR